MTCHYCNGERVLDNAIFGMVACRVCLGTGEERYEDDLGNEARPRELRRIAELLAQEKVPLVGLALFLSPVWEADSSDDVEAAKKAVNAFLAGEDGP